MDARPRCQRVCQPEREARRVSYCFEIEREEALDLSGDEDHRESLGYFTKARRKGVERA